VLCVETLQDAMARHGVPEIVNIDQGAQFTSAAYLNTLEAAGVAISMDGKGRVFDNILIERFWRSLKHEEVYLKRYESVAEAREAIGAYIRFYNEQRLHQALGYQTPYEVYYARAWGGRRGNAAPSLRLSSSLRGSAQARRSKRTNAAAFWYTNEGALRRAPPC
jgi:putative transposase